MKIKNLLRNLNDEDMAANEFTHAAGGVECGYVCNRASTPSANMSANYGGGITSPGTCIHQLLMERWRRYGRDCSDSLIRKIRYVAFIAVLICSCLSPCGLRAQRKDSDAKISPSNSLRSAKGQRDTVSVANIRIRYAFNAEDIKDKSTWIDEGQLKIAPDMTDYSSYFVEVNEDSLAHWLNTNKKSNVYPPARWLQGHRPDYWIEYQYSQITTKDGILTEWATMPRELDSENLYYTENLPLFNWQIGTETDTVCGYECIKATCLWRGRDFTAWFTPDIPVEYGPWKFGGLPGLIMMVSDDNGIYTFEAVAVETGNFPIFAPRGSKYKQSTREKVWKLQRALNEDYFKATGWSVFNIKLGREISSREHPYSQLELE